MALAVCIEMRRSERCVNLLDGYFISFLPLSIIWTGRGLLKEEDTVGDLKRKDVFIEPRPVRCVWSLMRPVTFMWHGIKDIKADKPLNRPTCCGQRVNYNAAAGLQYNGRNLLSGMMWRWVRHPPSLLANKALHTRRKDLSHNRHLCASFLNSSHGGSWVFSLEVSLFSTFFACYGYLITWYL